MDKGSGSQYTLHDAISESIRKRMLDLWTSIPGEVVAYNGENGTVDVEIGVKRMYADGTSTPYPTLKDVPIVWPRTSTRGFSFEMEPGDGVLLLFQMRSIDQWKRLGKGHPPKDARLFDISDAVAIPGLFPSTKKFTPKPTGDEIRGKNVKITGTESVSVLSPKINLSKDPNPTEPAVLGTVLKTNLENLIKAVDDLIAALTTAGSVQVNTGTGTGAVVATPAVLAAKSALATVKTALPNENSAIVKLE
jgi:hypothetical protein